MIPLTVSADGVGFAVRVVPRAGRTMIAGTRGDALLVRLTAAPADGAANAALLTCLAEALDVTANRILLVSGQRSRRKLVRVRGIAAAELAARLDAILGG